MASQSDQLTREIAATRGRMDRTLDDVGERAGPGRLKQRARTTLESARETIMGTAGHAQERVSETTHQAGSAVRDRSTGNPLAAGMVAFGAGLLAGSVIPESSTEKQLSREVQSKVQEPMREHGQRAAEQVSDRVGERAGEAKERVAAEARGAKEDVSSDLRERGEAVRHHVGYAAEDVRHDVEEQARRHSGR